jgi:hypothetical protein
MGTALFQQAMGTPQATALASRTFVSHTPQFGSNPVSFDAASKWLRQTLDQNGFSKVTIRDIPAIPGRSPRLLALEAPQLDAAEEAKALLIARPNVTDLSPVPTDPSARQAMEELRSFLQGRGLQAIVRYGNNTITVLDAKLPRNRTVYNAHVRTLLKTLPDIQERNPQDVNFWEFNYKGHRVALGVTGVTPLAELSVDGHPVVLGVKIV